ncbi:hypothetical protein Lfu02_05720 [Longispora fulva]|uniref:Diguanylate cyclase (GGDEF)-like protein/PAS domain S-box-containing protein n=1 Tax=Longispora fulva TaxID=619741 RepID=A0A8J7KJK6_9ACTN|nr:EAL domain-containing protein [Longispora fulva]MBG6135561.1 diguanylate cyclase (GGDEF)-like protein/PAS domain S-box-containing protein [Longispora fulva]GIG56200.1 hypothetical protein Lfu02_05720 [Longispora fulva]
MSSRAVSSVFVAWVTLLTATYYLAEPVRRPLWVLIGFSAATAVLVGVRRNRPRHPGLWWLLAAGMALFVAADIVTPLFGRPWRSLGTTSLLVDIFYLSVLVSFATALSGFARWSAGTGRASVLDGLTLIAAAGTISWTLLIAPRLGSPNVRYLGAIQQIAAVAYPLGDLLLLSIMVRLVVGARWTATILLLGAGGLAFFAANVVYQSTTKLGAWVPGHPVDAVWFVFLTSWGLAALRPGMTRLTEPGLARSSELTVQRLVLLAVCALIPPALLVAEAVRGPVDNGIPIATALVVITALVLARLIDAMRQNLRVLGRERGVRAAGVRFVAATSRAEVARVVEGAVADLLPAQTPHKVLLQLGDAGPGPEYCATCPRQGGPAHARCAWPEHAALCQPAALPPDLARAFRGFPLVLRCRLAPTGLSEPAEGTLHVAAADADRIALTELRPSLEVLALQAAMALSRIELTGEVHRRDSEAYFRTLVHNASDVILILNRDGTIRYGSPSAAEMFGDPAFLGTSFPDRLAEEDRADVLAWLGDPSATAAEHQASWTLVGDPAPVEVEASARDLSGDATVGGLVLTLHDVTERRQLERELTHRAFHDPLTGLANRALFAERVTQAVLRAHLTGTQAGVILIDLDDFKMVNDTLGHPVGDELLVKVAARLREVLRPDDLAARLGGDEFAILIEDAADRTAVENVASRVVTAMAVPVRLGGQLVRADASVGVASADFAADADELMSNADLALYAAKDAGKGHWRSFHPELHSTMVERMNLRTDLDRAISAGEFTVRYQPIVRLVDARVVGLEALARWEHPLRGTLPPAEFITVAEETGLIVPIGIQVMRHALTAAASWPVGDAGPAPYVGINVSVRQFRSLGMVSGILREMHAAGLPPDRVVVEITESLLLDENEQVWTDLARLRAAGARVAIDDFGTGYSSLSYLRQTALDLVKIDRSFITGLDRSPSQRALVDGIVGIAETLGLTVVAEGVETPAERDILIAMGCTHGQGYLFSKPMTEQETTGWLGRKD